MENVTLMWTINDQSLVWGERKGIKKLYLSYHFPYICQAKPYLEMSEHPFYSVVTDMWKLRNVKVMVVFLQRVYFLTAPSFSKILGNMREFLFFFWFKMLSYSGTKWSVIYCALKADKCSPTWAPKWRTDRHDPDKASYMRKFWNNNTTL